MVRQFEGDKFYKNCYQSSIKNDEFELGVNLVKVKCIIERNRQFINVGAKVADPMHMPLVDSKCTLHHKTSTLDGSSTGTSSGGGFAPANKPGPKEINRSPSKIIVWITYLFVI